jgi:hypothetical protein
MVKKVDNLSRMLNNLRKEQGLKSMREKSQSNWLNSITGRDLKFNTRTYKCALKNGNLEDKKSGRKIRKGYVINPETNRNVKVKGPTFLKLSNSGKWVFHDGAFIAQKIAMKEAVSKVKEAVSKMNEINKLQANRNKENNDMIDLLLKDDQAKYTKGLYLRKIVVNPIENGDYWELLTPQDPSQMNKIKSMVVEERKKYGSDNIQKHLQMIFNNSVVSYTDITDTILKLYSKMKTMFRFLFSFGYIMEKKQSKLNTK